MDRRLDGGVSPVVPGPEAQDSGRVTLHRRRPGPLVLLLLLLLLLIPTARAAAQGLRPNIVLIVTDDQGFGDLGRAGELDCRDPLANPAGCQHPLETALRAGGHASFTPNLDRLAREGVRFGDFHVAPLCAPTRAALMTGRFSQRTGVLHPVSDRQILAPGERTLAEVLRQAGYHTGMFGKWNLGENAPARPQDRGFDQVLQVSPAGLGFTADYWQNDCFGDTYFDESGAPVSFGPNSTPPAPGDPYCTEVLFDEARQFISDHVAQTPDRPFFAYIATLAPHDLRTAPPRRFVPPNDPDPSELYESLGVDPALADFYGAIHGIDEQLGALRAFLQGMDLEEDTILIVLGDNGSQLTGATTPEETGALFNSYGINPFLPGYADFTNPAGLRGLKGGVYEGAHRAFLFLRWPAGGITGESIPQIDALTHVSDVFPTLLDLAGIDDGAVRTESLDGISWKDLLSGAADQAFDRRTVFVQTDAGLDDPSTGASAPRAFFNFAVVTPEWRLVHPFSNASELYAATDRAQVANIAAAHGDVVAELESRWRDYYGEWIGLYDDAGDRGRVSIGDSRARTQTLATNAWIQAAEFGRGAVPVTYQDGISISEDPVPVRGMWALQVSSPGIYSIRLRRWPGLDLAPPAIAERPIDPRGGRLGTPRDLSPLLRRRHTIAERLWCQLRRPREPAWPGGR